MTQHVDFYFDFVSPAAYLAYKRLQQMQRDYDLNVNAIPFFLGGVFKATDTHSPIAVPAKAKYMLEQDLPRFAKRYQVPFRYNPFFPFNTLPLLRGAIAAQQLGICDTYMDVVFDGIWVQEQNLGDATIAAALLREHHLDADALFSLGQEPDIKQQLINHTEQAVSRGAFGAPTLFMNGEMFFGQDRLDFIEAALT